MGRGHGRGALTLQLENVSDRPLHVVVPAGTIFQHVSWVHRQNLLVGRNVCVDLQPGESKTENLGAYCMNLTCSCSNGEPMELTAFCFEDVDVLQSQGKVWDHFEAAFSRLRAQNGFPDQVKKKKKGKKKQPT